MMNELDALSLMVRSYPGGRDVVAQRLGKRSETLGKELAGVGMYKFSVVDAGALAAMCREVGSPHAAAYAMSVAEASGVQMRVPHRPGVVVSASDLVQSAARAMRESSDVMADVAEAVRDGRVSANELRHASREIDQAIEALHEVRTQLAALHHAGRPQGAA